MDSKIRNTLPAITALALMAATAGASEASVDERFAALVAESDA